MIILSLCQSCFQKYELLIEASDLPLLKEISDQHGYTCPCPRLCGGTINLTGNSISEIVEGKQLAEPIFLTGKELYKAVKGMGLPDEIRLDTKTAEFMLTSSSIKDADIEEYKGHYYLHELLLANGVVIHLAAGLKGAQILKITKEKK